MATDEKLDELERFYMERIEELRLAYEEAAKPYVKRLIEIKSLRPAPPLLIERAEAIKLGLVRG